MFGSVTVLHGRVFDPLGAGGGGQVWTPFQSADLLFGASQRIRFRCLYLSKVNTAGEGERGLAIADAQPSAS